MQCPGVLGGVVGASAAHGLVGACGRVARESALDLVDVVKRGLRGGAGVVVPGGDHVAQCGAEQARVPLVEGAHGRHEADRQTRGAGVGEEVVELVAAAGTEPDRGSAVRGDVTAQPQQHIDLVSFDE